MELVLVQLFCSIVAVQLLLVQATWKENPQAVLLSIAVRVRPFSHAQQISKTNRFRPIRKLIFDEVDVSNNLISSGR